jgi:hypothetical protein
VLTGTVSLLDIKFAHFFLQRTNNIFLSIIVDNILFRWYTENSKVMCHGAGMSL